MDDKLLIAFTDYALGDSAYSCRIYFTFFNFTSTIVSRPMKFFFAIRTNI